MPSVRDFRRRLREAGADTIVAELLLTGEAKHVTNNEKAAMSNALLAAFSSQGAQINLHIVGSAKLGFSIVEKKKKNLKRYRPFSATSDIDVAVVCPAIFKQVWSALSDFSHRAARWPWEAGRLGDYLVCGWIRPDHFPKKVRLRRCDDWWDCFRRISVEVFLGRREVRGGLYYSEEHLSRYLRRAVEECIRIEELTYEDRAN